MYAEHDPPQEDRQHHSLHLHRADPGRVKSTGVGRWFRCRQMSALLLAAAVVAGFAAIVLLSQQDVLPTLRQLLPGDQSSGAAATGALPLALFCRMVKRSKLSKSVCSEQVQSGSKNQARRLAARIVHHQRLPFCISAAPEMRCALKHAIVDALTALRRRRSQPCRLRSADGDQVGGADGERSGASADHPVPRDRPANGKHRCRPGGAYMPSFGNLGRYDVRQRLLDCGAVHAPESLDDLLAACFQLVCCISQPESLWLHDTQQCPTLGVRSILLLLRQLIHVADDAQAALQQSLESLFGLCKLRVTTAVTPAACPPEILLQHGLGRSGDNADAAACMAASTCPADAPAREGDAS